MVFAIVVDEKGRSREESRIAAELLHCFSRALAKAIRVGIYSARGLRLDKGNGQVYQTRYLGQVSKNKCLGNGNLNRRFKTESESNEVWWFAPQASSPPNAIGIKNLPFEKGICCSSSALPCPDVQLDLRICCVALPPARDPRLLGWARGSAARA